LFLKLRCSFIFFNFVIFSFFVVGWLRIQGFGGVVLFEFFLFGLWFGVCWVVVVGFGDLFQHRCWLKNPWFFEGNVENSWLLQGGLMIAHLETNF
jgi:hypothetical protein